MKKIFFIFWILLFSTNNLFSETNKLTTEEDILNIYKSVVKIDSIIPPEARTAQSLGTVRGGNGVVIDDKHILTIGYIVVEAETITITLPDGKKFPGELIGYDHTTGFGILRTIIQSNLKPLKIGDSDQLTKEDFLYVLPYLTEGRPSAVKMVSRRSFAGWWEYFLDKPIYTYPANSSFAGSALINEYGEVLGIGSLYVGDAAATGISSPGNMFVPINDLKPILDDLIENGRRTKDIKPYMGLTSSDNTGQVKITRVNDNGPAAKAGFSVNDTILAVNNEKINNIEDFYKVVWSFGGPGTKLQFDIERNQKKLNIELTTMDRNDFFVKPKYY
ncbi:S1C family serine protease [Candidatus Pelagibacter sp. HIMB1695]|uniref:S1C family serine protease n=1 Tax=Candidatus Pelagibacter sp. HIMB1695 TaxID=3413364 RepID=UPI003F87CC50